jgi:hypothetical protein
MMLHESASALYTFMMIQLISVRIKNGIKRWSENIKQQMAKMLYVVFSEDAVMICRYFSASREDAF